MRDTIELLGAQSPLASQVAGLLNGLRDDLRLRDIERTIHPDAFGRELAYLNESLHEIADAIELAYFTSLRPTSVLIPVAPGAPLTPQQQQQQQQ